jgi:hypothetical protein
LESWLARIKLGREPSKILRGELGEALEGVVPRLRHESIGQGRT